ncbi:Ipi1p [Sugiyamaella lignohabitans]|uniref:Ipi1p n=1 Tax=Sugiyamaella lignohabitans TaxID=796027 RepID=A0A167FXC2_9ASCO|nr:Ipi1p [Sugiyamaella lignohabitans]ANB15824.1 Ipi1p [Sugiyamaella lignohabitans]
MSSHSPFIMLYVHSAMTHITPEIRAQSTDFLNILLETVPEQVSRLSWAKTLKCFFPLLGWPLEDEKKTSSGPKHPGTTISSASVTTGLSFGASAAKTKLAHIMSLDKLLNIGLDEALDSASDNLPPFHHPETAKFLLPIRSGPYATLGLFSRSTGIGGTNSSTSQHSTRSSTPISESTDVFTVTEDVESRCGLVKTVYYKSLTRGLENTVKEAGQVGRVSSNMLKFLEQRVS